MLAGSMATGRRQFVFALGGAAAAWPLAARAEPPSYPERPLTMVVTFSAGGSSDVLARAVADAMSHGLAGRWRWTIIQVEGTAAPEAG